MQLKTMQQTKQIPENQTEHLVATGCLATGSGTGVIRSTPMGSCVAVVAYDKTSKTGGIAHTMLPGKSPKESKTEENKYAENAIENLLNELKSLGGNKANIEICLVGEANVLRRENDTTADNLILSIFEMMERKKAKHKKEPLWADTKDALQNCVCIREGLHLHLEIKSKRNYLILFPVIQEE